MGEFDFTEIIKTFITANIFAIVLSIASRIICLVLTPKIAKERERDAAVWFCLALLLGWLATLIVAITKAPPYDNNETVETESSANYSLTGKKTASTSNVFTTYNQPKPKPVVKTEKWTCSCGQVNNPNATMCIECGKEKE